LDLQGELEGILAEKIVADLWRLRRVPIFEAMLYKRGCAELLVRTTEELVQQYQSTESDRLLASLARSDVRVSDPKAHEDALRRHAGAQAQLDDPSLNITLVLQTSPDPFLNLWRHEAMITRSMLRLLHELERLQAKRAGQHVTVPAVVDVDVSLSESSPPSGETNGGRQ